MLLISAFNVVKNLSCVATSVLRMRLLHVVAFSKKLRWLAQTKVITLKTEMHAVNACEKRLSQRSFNPSLFRMMLLNRWVAKPF
jgi:hypothetical protein